MKLLVTCSALCLLALGSLAELGAQMRAPATPLVAHNPYFSIWSAADKLTDAHTTHWTGSQQPITGLVRIDRKPFRFMGRDPQNIPAMRQISVQITPTHTRYLFAQSGLELELSFFTPSLPNDLDLLSRPVTYLSWSAHSTDGAAHAVDLLLDVDPVLSLNERNQPVTTFRHESAALHLLSTGSRDQQILNRSGDDLRIDWGYFHLAVPKNESADTVIAPHSAERFAAEGSLAGSDVVAMPQVADWNAPHLATVLHFGEVSSAPVKRHLLVAYTEDFAIEYLNRKLHPWWQRNGMSVEAMLDLAEKQYAELELEGSDFDRDLAADLEKSGGREYASLAVLAYRQTLAASGLVADFDGRPMHFPKENFSNGCIATVDVIYPAAPFFLFLQPRLLEAELLPVLEYAALPRWKFPFAPHDLGKYPLANGQVYGGGEMTEEDQMPVEESGNLILLVDALERAENNNSLADRYWPQLSQWAQFLRTHGLDPENQLTTDDFAGHVAHNANLSLKAIEALAAYADLAARLHKQSIADDYSAAAKNMAAQWMAMAEEGDHYKLAFNSPNTWSQKYNLVWDDLLGFHLFPPTVREREMAFYMKKLNQYGLPLDVRADYTKLDWSIWTATLASDPAQFSAIMRPVYRWINETPTRVPLTDWYDTKNGRQIAFQARSVVGGVYIKALANRELAAKWNAWSNTVSAPASR